MGLSMVMMMLFGFGFSGPNRRHTDRQPGSENLPKRQADALLSLAALDMAHRSRP